MVESKDLTMIQISKKTRTELTRLKIIDRESYESVIKRLMNNFHKLQQIKGV